MWTQPTVVAEHKMPHNSFQEALQPVFDSFVTTTRCSIPEKKNSNLPLQYRQLVLPIELKL